MTGFGIALPTHCDPVLAQASLQKSLDSQKN